MKKLLVTLGSIGVLLGAMNTQAACPEFQYNSIGNMDATANIAQIPGGGEEYFGYGNMNISKIPGETLFVSVDVNGVKINGLAHCSSPVQFNGQYLVNASDPFEVIGDLEGFTGNPVIGLKWRLVINAFNQPRLVFFSDDTSEYLHVTTTSALTPGTDEMPGYGDDEEEVAPEEEVGDPEVIDPSESDGEYVDPDS